MDLTAEKWKKWRRKRKNTVYGFLIICVVGGMDCSIVFATLYIYLTTQVKTDKANLYYGLIIAVYSCSSTLLGLICGRLTDKYRKIRLYANITLVLQIVGSLIYVIPFSPAYLLVGRLIAGAGDSLKVLLKNPNVVVILLSSFFFMYCLFESDVLLPLITLELMKWDNTALTLIFVVYGVIYFFALMIFSRLCTSDSWISNMTIICILLQMVGFGLFIAMKIFPRNVATDVILMIGFLVCYIFVWFIEEVLLTCILAKMVSSHVQSFTESLRNGFSRAATVLAAVTAPMVLVVLHYWSMALLGTTFIFLLIFLSKRKSFVDAENIRI